MTKRMIVLMPLLVMFSTQAMEKKNRTQPTIDNSDKNHITKAESNKKSPSKYDKKIGNSYTARNIIMWQKQPKNSEKWTRR